MPAMLHSLSGSATQSGWFIGGGIEHVLWQNVTGKIEYQYLDFGSEDVALSGSGMSATFDVDQQVHLLKVGINYKF
jgi:outer membrane immunogenic protein